MSKKWLGIIALVAILLGALGLPAQAAAPKTYQVTGPVLELTSDMIVVKKGNDRWEIARDAATKVTGDLKVGSTVTIQYRMAAATVDVKPEKGAKGAAAGKKKDKKGSLLLTRAHAVPRRPGGGPLLLRFFQRAGAAAGTASRAHSAYIDPE